MVRGARSPREEKHAIPRSPSTPDSKFFTPPLRKISLVKTEKTERTIISSILKIWPPRRSFEALWKGTRVLTLQFGVAEDIF